MPKWRGPVCVLDIDETGVTARYPSQTFRAARYCARRREDEKEVGSNAGPPGLKPTCERYNPSALGFPNGPPWRKDPPVAPSTLEAAQGAMDKSMVTQEERVSREVELQDGASNDGAGEGVNLPMSRGFSSGVPDSPPLPFHLPSSFSSSDKNGAPARATASDFGFLDHLSYDLLRDLRKQHSHHR